MCGIAGAVVLDAEARQPSRPLVEIARRMSDRLVHRGPDASGVWVSGRGTVVLAHRRLAIVDLSERGRQPMSYAGGRYWIVFNGEIYNFRELTARLRALGHQFASGSDTEVILAAVTEWGLEDALRQLVGMFAFALWDESEQRLYLARDRLGEKPLYFGVFGGHLYFASELQALHAAPGFPAKVDPRTVAAYLRDGYVSGESSIYEGVQKLPPAHYLGLSVGKSFATAMRPVPYWSVVQAAVQGQSSQLRDEHEIVERLESALRDSVRLQMHADVPSGAFLSGGIDSSLVVALMQAQSGTPVHTFTVAFDNPAFDESPQARAISAHLGTKHEEFSLHEAEIVRRIPGLVGALDEPTANASFFPVYLISELARSRVKVVLSGDGGDELFGGYNRYALAQGAWRSVSWLPGAVRRPLAAALMLPNFRWLDSKVSQLAGATRLGSQVTPSAALAKFARVAASKSFSDSYAGLVSCWDGEALLDPAINPPARRWREEISGDFSRMLLADQLDYLPGDSLAKVDRASMAVSLETRVPLLDHRIVELSWRLPQEWKLAEGVTKRALRSVLYRYIPRELLERKKMGFTVPLDAWLSGPLKDWAEDTLRSSNYLADLPFRSGAIKRAWQDYLARRKPSAYAAWALVMLAAWAAAARARS